MSSVPEDICRVFDDTLVDSDDGRKLFITIGLFTIVRLERDTELIVHVVDYCIPSNECVASSADNSPCDFFDRLRFPVDEFFPPEKDQFESLEGSNDNCCCN